MNLPSEGEVGTFLCHVDDLGNEFLLLQQLVAVRVGADVTQSPECCPFAYKRRLLGEHFVGQIFDVILDHQVLRAALSLDQFPVEMHGRVYALEFVRVDLDGEVDAAQAHSFTSKRASMRN